MSGCTMNSALLEEYRKINPELSNLTDEQFKLVVESIKNRNKAEQKHEGSTVGGSIRMADSKEELDPDFYINVYSDLRPNGVGDAQSAMSHYRLYGKSEKRYPNFNKWLEAHGFESEGFSVKSIAEIVLLNRSYGLEINYELVINALLGNVKAPIRLFLEDSNNGYFYFKQGKKFLGLGDRVRGKLSLKASLYFHKISGAFELLGNLYLDDGHYEIALSYYDSALNLEGASKWSYANKAHCLAKLNNFSEAIAVLVAGYSKFPEFTYYIDKLDEYSEGLWNKYQGEAHFLTDNRERDLLIEKANTYSRTVYDAYFKAYGGEATFERKSSINTSKVLIVADYHVPQCVRYRINQKIEQLELAGKKVSAINWVDLSSNKIDIAIHDIVIFYRVPAVPQVLKALAKVNAANKISIYEIDDLLFDPVYPPPLETYGGYVDLNTYQELVKGMALFNSAAQFCQLGMATTLPLAKELKKLVMRHECIVHRNGLDSLNKFKVVNKKSKKYIDIFYGSGTQAHNTDFLELALPAISKIFDKYHNVRLIIAGYLKLPSYFKEIYSDRYVCVDAVKSVQAYWSYLENADISLAVLHNDRINSCKSELKWFEAACFAIPSILSRTDNYCDVVRDGCDAFLATTPDEWYEALDSLVSDAALRERVGKLAMERAKADYSIQALSESLSNSIDKLAYPCVKKKIALVNVFFPPQSVGGATRVVADNFSALIKDYKDRYEVCVFTTDVECRSPHQLSVYNFQGARVYRSTVLFREHMDWHPKDKEMYEIFYKFLELEKPDFIHFHCVQRLTASVVEAARDVKIPYIITLHDAWWISDFQFLVDHKENVYLEGHPDPYEKIELPKGISIEDSIERKVYLKELLNAASYKLSVSESFAELYDKNHITSIFTIKNGVSDEVEWRPKRTGFTQRVVLGHVGSMSAHKGYFLLKQSVIETQPINIEMLIVDHSKDEGYESQESWGSVPVKFIGRVSQKNISSLYERIDVLFAPSIWPESFGLVSREAAACNCWVVASSLGGIAEDIIDEVSGFVIEPNIESLKHVVSLINSKPLMFKGPAPTPDIRFSIDQVKELEEYYRII